MKQFLSFGGGVNSVALLLWLIDQGIEFEAVYADLQCDWPETREYVEMLQETGYPITVLETKRYGLNLYDYCMAHQAYPAIKQRWCTAEYKVKPLRAYMQGPSVVYMGIAMEEASRINKIGYGTGDMRHEFPLVEEGIDRAECERIILAHGLLLPVRSRCFFCPGQRVQEWRDLYQQHPDLFLKARELEQLVAQKQRAKGKKPYYFCGKGRPLDKVARAGWLDLEGERPAIPCICTL